MVVIASSLKIFMPNGPGFLPCRNYFIRAGDDGRGPSVPSYSASA
jgi:hypothetical protein